MSKAYTVSSARISSVFLFPHYSSLLNTMQVTTVSWRCWSSCMFVSLLKFRLITAVSVRSRVCGIATCYSCYKLQVCGLVLWLNPPVCAFREISIHLFSNSTCGFQSFDHQFHFKCHPKRVLKNLNSQPSAQLVTLPVLWDVWATLP